MAICANCGNIVEDGAKFCENCGAPQMQAVSNAVQSQQNAYGSQPQGSSYTAGNETGYSAGSAYNTGSSPSAGAGYSSGSSYSAGTDYSSGSSYSAGAGYSSGSSYSAGAGYSSGSPYNVPNRSNPLPTLTFMEAVQSCFSKYATFSGRARRSEYWWYTLFIVIVQIVLGIVGNIIFGAPETASVNILQSIFSLATFCPSLAVFWRRMHDIDKSGAWFFLSFVPCVGGIILLVFACQDSHPGENRFGMSPKYPQ